MGGPERAVGLSTPPDLPADPRVVAAVPPGGRARFQDVLHHRPYLLYQSGAIAAATGYSIYAISIPWLALETTGSFLVVGLVLFLEIGIYSLTFLVAPLVDRVADKRWILVVGFPLQAGAALTIALASLRGELQLPLLLGLVSGLAVAWDFEWAVFQVAPRILLPKDLLFAAGGITSALGGGATIGGFAAGAVFILLTGPAASGFLYAALLLGAAALVIQVPLRAPRSSATSYLGGFFEGWSYFGTAEGRPLLQLGFLDAAVGFFSNGPAVLITLFADRSFADPAAAYGVLFTALVVGGVLTDLALGYWNPRERVGVVMVAGLAGAAAALALVGRTTGSLALTAVVWALAGAALGAYSSGKVTFEWGYIPPERLARVTSNLFLFPGVSGAAGALLLGTLAASWPPVAVAELVAGVLTGALVLALTLPAIRRFAF